MKAILFLTLTIVSAMTAEAVTYKDVTLTTAGTLNDALGTDGYTIDSLVVRGPIGEDDFSTMWDCAFHGHLTVINLEFSEPEYDAVPNFAFDNCHYQSDGRLGLKRVILPENLRYIGGYSFTRTDIETINLPASLEYIGTDAFAGCPYLNLESMYIPAGITEIPSSCFTKNHATDVLIIPSTVKKIDMYAFCENSFKVVSFSEGLESIGGYAFATSWELIEVTLPQSCTEVIMGAFYSCDKLRTLRLPEGLKTIPEILAWECTALEYVSIPSTVEYIGNGAFRDTGLTQVSLPASLLTLDDYCFNNCKALKWISCMAAEPPLCGKYCFDGVDLSIPIYVPSGSAAAYRAADVWKDFNNIREQPEAGINDVTVDNDENTPVEYYNLQGMRINEPAAGQIVLRRQGSKTTKILVK